MFLTPRALNGFYGLVGSVWPNQSASCSVEISVFTVGKRAVAIYFSNDRISLYLKSFVGVIIVGRRVLCFSVCLFYVYITLYFLMPLFSQFLYNSIYLYIYPLLFGSPVGSVGIFCKEISLNPFGSVFGSVWYSRLFRFLVQTK